MYYNTAEHKILTTFEEIGLLRYALRVCFEHTINESLKRELKTAYSVLSCGEQSLEEQHP